MKAKTLLLLSLLGTFYAVGQPPPAPYPRGLNPPVNQGDGVWRFDRPRGPEPGFFEQLVAMFDLIEPPRTLPFGRSIAFLVGVGPYDHLDALTHTSSDVSSMRNFLLESGEFDTVFEVRDDKVNSALLNKYMLNYFSRSDPKYLTGRDRFLFYYSGHGGNQGDLGYLLFSKADPKSGDYVTDALDMSAVRSWAYVSVAKQVLMILDTCNSGLAIRPMNGNPLGGPGDDPSGILLTAGTGNQEAYQVGSNQKGYGVFTHAILEALQAGTSAESPFMDIFEVYGRARATVRSFEIEKGRKMQPDMDQRLRRKNFDSANGNFVFLNRNPAAKNSRPGKQFAGMAIEKKGIGGDLAPGERLRLAQRQFDLLKNSDNVVPLYSYIEDYRSLAGAATWVALINARIDQLRASAKLVNDEFSEALQRVLAEVPTEFVHYGASELNWPSEAKWTPLGKMPESLQCTGISSPAPLVRCTVYRSSDLDAAERRLDEITLRVQSALPGSGWTRDESLDRALSDYDENWSRREVVFKSVSTATVESQLWKSKKDGHYEVDVVVLGIAHIRQELQRMIAEASTGFVNYGAGNVFSSGNGGSLSLTLGEAPKEWRPAGKLPDSLECAGTSTSTPLIRCTMFRSPDLSAAERRLGEVTVQIQAALLGSGWAKDESLRGVFRDYDTNWWQRAVAFKDASAITVEAQLWKSKKDSHYEVDVVVRGVATTSPSDSISSYIGQSSLGAGALTGYGSVLGAAPSYSISQTPVLPYLNPNTGGNLLTPFTGVETFPEALARLVTEVASNFDSYGTSC